MARYWRLVNLLTYSGHLSLSDVQLYDGATKIPTTASATVPPSIGTVVLLDDGLSDEAVTWLRCSDPGFAVVLDAGTSYDAVSLRLGSGASAADYPRDVTLQTSADLINWTTHVSYVHANWPGAFSLTLAVDTGVAGDPDYSSVSLLLAGNGVNGSTTFVDNSPTPKPITPYGNAQISTAQSKFGGSSMYFDGAGAYLAVPNSERFELAATDFTLQFWMNTTTTLVYAGVIGKDTGTFPAGAWAVLLNGAGSGSIQLWNSSYSLGSPMLSAGAATVNDGIWHHIALTRSESAWALFKDGLSIASVSWAGTIAALDVPLSIGRDQGYPRDFAGYIDDLRITKGVARYTANFAPPTAAFPTTGSGGAGFTVDSPTPSRLRLSAPRPDLYLPGVALPDSAVQLGLGGKTFIDVYNGGLGTITGTVKEKNTPVNTPLRRRVLLIDEASRMTIRETWSDPVTGAFEFRGVKQGVKYSTISYDHLHNYRAVIADNQEAA